MSSHPFLNRIPAFLLLLLLTVITAAGGAWMLVEYQDYTWGKAVAESSLQVTLWVVMIWCSWYINLYVKVWQAKAVAGLMLQLLIISVLYIVLVLFHITDEYTLLKRAPFLLIFGGLVWIITMQWYAACPVGEEDEESLPQIPESGTLQADNPLEPIQNISVKDGSRIHIIPVEDIFYIQACRDYVNIFTTEGQFIKEQTMKSLEATLPLLFIRIHRSTIINAAQLLRIELFGKDNYHVLLKNSVTLKASLAGYKLLKSRLNL